MNTLSNQTVAANQSGRIPELCVENPINGIRAHFRRGTTFWDDWLYTWDQTTYTPALLGLVHEGLTMSAHGDKGRRIFAPAYEFFVRLSNEHGFTVEDHQKDKQRIKDLAFQMLCRHVFKLGMVDDCSNYEWLPYLDSINAIKLTMWFLEQPHKNHRQGSPHQVQEMNRFIKGFIEMHWNLTANPKKSYRIQTQGLCDFLVANCSWAIQWAYNNGEVLLLEHLQLSDADCRCLHDCIMGENIYVAEEGVLRQPKSLNEAVVYGTRQRQGNAFVVYTQALRRHEAATRQSSLLEE